MVGRCRAVLSYGAKRACQREVGSRVADIDPESDIELHTVNEHLIARVPLAGPVTEEWLGCYQRLARATEVPVQTQGRPDRAWIIVSVPADGNQREVAATMDAARALIAEADAAQRRPATAQAESIVRDWWARLGENGARRPISKVETARTGMGVEKRWPLPGSAGRTVQRQCPGYEPGGAAAGGAGR